MTRFVRWKGVIAFLAIVICISLFVYLFADNIVKRALIYSAESTVGAEVNIDDVDIAYFPTGITVKQLQITDAQAPEFNQVSLREFTTKIDLWQYFQGKLILDDLIVHELAFNTLRSQIGEVYQSNNDTDLTNAESVNSPEEGDLLSSINTELPDVKTLLEDSSLLTVKNSQLLENIYKEEEAKIKKLKDDLPSKQVLAEYQAKVKALSKRKIKSLDDISAAKAEFDVLKKQFKADKVKVKLAKDQISKSKSRISKQLTALKNSPTQDWQYIEKKYQLDKVDSADFAHILFGEQAREYVKYIEIVQQKLLPLLANEQSNEKKEDTQINDSEEGRFVHFYQEEDLPSFLIKHALVSVHNDNRVYEINIENLTHQHWLQKMRTKINATLLKANNTKNLSLATSGITSSESFVLEYMFAFNELQDFNGEGKWEIQGFALKDIVLKKSSRISLAIEQGILSAKGALMQNNELIESLNEFQLSQLLFSGEGQSSIMSTLVDLVKSNESLAINLEVSGNINSPDIAISSPLDGMVSDALTQQLTAKLSTFKGNVQKGLEAKISNSLSDGAGDAANFKQMEGSLNGVDSSLSDLLNMNMSKAHEKQLKNKVKDKFKKLFG